MSATATVLVSNVNHLEIVKRINVVHLYSRTLPVSWSRELNRWSRVEFTLFGGDKNNTISSSSAIDGSRGRVFEYRNRLDVVGVHQVGIHLHVVYQHQWFATIERSGTTHVERSTSTRSATVSHGYVKVGHNTLQTLSDVANGSVFQHTAIHRCHSTCKVGFLLCAITHHNHLVEVVHTALQYHLHAFLGLYCLRFKARVRECEQRARSSIHREISIDVCHRSVTSARHFHRNTGERFARIAGYWAFN